MGSSRTAAPYHRWLLLPGAQAIATPEVRQRRSPLTEQCPRDDLFGVHRAELPPAAVRRISCARTLDSDNESGGFRVGPARRVPATGDPADAVRNGYGRNGRSYRSRDIRDLGTCERGA